MRVISRDTPHCRVCGCSRMRTDEVVDRRPILLAECARCGHRWTAPLPHSAALPHWGTREARQSGETARGTASAGSLRGAPVSLRAEGARVA